MKVAVITSSLRADACIAYMSSISDASPYVILTADPGAFVRDEVEATYEVRRLTTGPLRVGGTGTAMAARRNLVGWTRSGSRAGHLVGALARRMVGVRRRLSRPAPDVETITPRREQLYDQLVDINGKEPIEQICVFDLFDLPTTLEFSHDFGVEVVVR